VCLRSVAMDVGDLFEAEFERLVRALGVAFSPEAAADAVQEAFIRADHHWHRVGRLDDPAGWVRRVALNLLTNGRRDERRRTSIVSAVRPVPATDLTVDLLDLRRAIDALAPTMRLTLCLFHLAGLSIDEIAAALGVAPGTVKSNLHDARRRLRADLQEVSDVDDR
jgi:RNA polymerase sigma-70 factor, ECF subfamily